MAGKELHVVKEAQENWERVWRDRKKPGLVSLRPKADSRRSTINQIQKDRSSSITLQVGTKAPMACLPTCSQKLSLPCQTQVFPSENLSLLLEQNLDS